MKCSALDILIVAPICGMTKHKYLKYHLQSHLFYYRLPTSAYLQMDEPIQCNFARCAIYYFTTKYKTSQHKLPHGSMNKILHDYNQHFADTPQLKSTYTTASKKFQSITKIFGKKWYPHGAREDLLTTFSPSRWESIDPQEKCQHILRGCKVCKDKYESHSYAFPLSSRPKKAAKPVQISFSPEDISTPKQFGSKLLNEANSIYKTHFQKSVQQVITETPRSRLTSKPRHIQRQSKRQILKDIKNSIESEMNTEGDMLVLQNRLSWSNFNRIRKSQGLSGTKRKRPTENDAEQPHTKRKHHHNFSKLQINKTELLQEAQSWKPDEQVNWSHLGRRYGLSTPNCGQVIKQFLAEQGIPAADINQPKLATRLVGTTAVLVVRLIAHVLMTWLTVFVHIVPH